MKSIRKNHGAVIIMTLIILFTFAAAALAVDNIDDFNKELNKQEQPVPQNNLLLDFIKLVVVLGLIIGAAWSIIRLFGQRANSRLQGTWLHTVDEVMLGQNRGLVLCEVAGKIYAVGVTDHNINLLFEVDNPQLLKEISEYNFEEYNKPDNAFKHIMDRLLSLFYSNKRSPRPARDFHLLMEEQSRKLRHISAQGMETGEVNKKSYEEDE